MEGFDLSNDDVTENENGKKKEVSWEKSFARPHLAFFFGHLNAPHMRFFGSSARIARAFFGTFLLSALLNNDVKWPNLR